MEEFPLAVRENVWLRMCLMGMTKSGKTDGALAVATSLSEALGGLDIVGIDTENGRMNLYANRYTFRHSTMVDDYAPETWIAKMSAAERTYPGGILVLDSVTHEWSGRMGVLEQVDRFGGWKEATPRHQSFLGRIASLQMHVIVCVRSKMKYTQEDGESEGGRKKQVVKKLGVGPEQRENFVYEFDLVGEVDLETHLTTFSSRDDVLMGPPVDLRDPAVGEVISKWLSEGVPMQEPETADPEKVEELRALLLEEGRTELVIEERFAVARRQNRGHLHPEYVEKNIALAKDRLAAKARRDAKPAEAAEPKPAEEPAPA